MRGMMAEQMEKDGATESQIAAIRMTPADKKKIVNEFSAKNNTKIQEEVSVNPSSGGVDGTSLLQGDSSEELRMADRLKEKKQNALDGKMPRVTVDDIRPSQRLPKEDAKDGLLIKEEEKERSDSMGFKSDAGRRKSATNKQSPNFQKFDANLKKQLIAAEKERTEKAKRDAEDERNREMEEFKQSGHGTAANVIMPQYEKDEILDCDREIKKPPESQYIGLGWDEDATTGRKHYRRFFNDELENVKSVL